MYGGLGLLVGGVGPYLIGRVRPCQVGFGLFGRRVLSETLDVDWDTGGELGGVGLGSPGDPLTALLAIPRSRPAKAGVWEGGWYEVDEWMCVWVGGVL